MLFITNRMRAGSPRLRPGRPFRFDMRYNTPSTSIYFCRRNGEDDCTEVGSTSFFDELSQCAEEHIVLFIHGFNVLPDAAFSQARNLQTLWDALQPNQVRVIPLIWPCDDDVGIVGDKCGQQRSPLEAR